jgi:RNA polymerase sigma-70 factor (ECF subfamily)
MESGDPVDAAKLMGAHGAWLRRLALGLLRDPAAADDVVQDTWEVALRRPPRHSGSLRAWLGRIVSNNVRNRARTAVRRQAREQATAPDADTAPSADEIAGAVELQQRLAALVSALDEPARQVIWLRYYEGLEPTEIARKLGVPPGTVRWRIKMALDELRRRLDDEQGERWRVVLALLAGRDEATRPRPVLATAAGVVLVVAIGLLISLGGRRHQATGRAPDLATTGGGRPPAFVSVPILAAAASPPCPALGELQRALELRKHEFESREPLKAQFARAAPNAASERVFGAAYDEGMRKVGKCSHTLECRGAVCRVQVLVPTGMRVFECFPEGRETWLQDRIDGASINSGTPTYDPVSKQTFDRYELHYRLAAPDGNVVTRDRRPRAPLATGLLRPRSLPAGMSAACRTEGGRLIDELRSVETLLAALAVPMEVFAAGDPNPELVDDMKREVSRLLALDGKPLPFVVECRATVCTVEATPDLDPALANHWTCRPAEGGRPEICNPDRLGNGWYVRLEREAYAGGILDRPIPPHRRDDKDGKAYFHVRTGVERARLDHIAWGCALIQRTGAASVPVDCGKRFPGERGSLRVQVRIPGPDDPAPRRTTVQYGGTLAGTPLGKCVAEQLNAALGSEEVPELRNGWVIYRTFDFPGSTEFNPCAKK